jgi:hypothetical protein
MSKLLDPTAQPGGICSFESILGLFKSLKIRALPDISSKLPRRIQMPFSVIAALTFCRNSQLNYRRFKSVIGCLAFVSVLYCSWLTFDKKKVPTVSFSITFTEPGPKLKDPKP